MELILSDLIEGDDIKEYASNVRASLMKNDGIWTIQSVIEEKDDSIFFRAAPYKEEIQDNGIHYYRHFLKDKGARFSHIIVREEADDQYRKLIDTILKSLE